MEAQRFIDIRRQLHQIPEPGFMEFKTQQFILDFITQLPQERLSVKKWKTGLLAKVSGTHPSKTIAYRTDMDGLPIKEETTYEFSSLHKGFMHACGHDIHMSVALGLLDYFVNHPVKDDLLFVFQPAEEGPGGTSFASKRRVSVRKTRYDPRIAYRSGISGWHNCGQRRAFVRQHV